MSTSKTAEQVALEMAVNGNESESHEYVVERARAFFGFLCGEPVADAASAAKPPCWLDRDIAVLGQSQGWVRYRLNGKWYDLDGAYQEYTAKKARKLAAKLLLAADEIDGLNEELPAWDPDNPSHGDVVQWGCADRVYRHGSWFLRESGGRASSQHPHGETYTVIARGGKPVAA